MVFKKIIYRGGIVIFSLPQDWIEEYEPEGGGTFYEARPDSGTLRLNVLSFQAPPDEPAENMACHVFKVDAVEQLPSGFLMRQNIETGVEEGQQLEFHRWEIAVPVPPNKLRLVIFTHTILAGQQNDPQIATELRLLNENIRQAEFSQEPGN